MAGEHGSEVSKTVGKLAAGTVQKASTPGKAPFVQKVMWAFIAAL